MVTPPAGAEEGMLMDVAVLEGADDPAPEEAGAVERPGVKAGGSGAKAESMQRSAHRATM